jgi:hypothetical protein
LITHARGAGLLRQVTAKQLLAQRLSCRADEPPINRQSELSATSTAPAASATKRVFDFFAGVFEV